jgi:hypothetical protein
MRMRATVYLIPTVLSEGVTNCLPAYVLDAVKKCSVFFVENERTARRYLKLLWKEMVIDDYEWFTMKDGTGEVASSFHQKLKEGRTIGIISEAGCPGVADPGQVLVNFAQQKGALVKPLVGPNSILLALMASGMNGQRFQFVGYLPIDIAQRAKVIKSLDKFLLKHLTATTSCWRPLPKPAIRKPRSAWQPISLALQNSFKPKQRSSGGQIFHSSTNALLSFCYTQRKLMPTANILIYQSPNIQFPNSPSLSLLLPR